MLKFTLDWCNFPSDFERKWQNMRHISNVPEIFGRDVFTEATMKQRLAANVYESWKTCIETGTPLT